MSCSVWSRSTSPPSNGWNKGSRQRKPDSFVRVPLRVRSEENVSLHPQSLDEIDFWDLDMFSQGDPHAAWTILRREAPVWLHDRPGGEPFYSVTRYEDCRRVHAHSELFSSERHGIVLRNADSMALAAAGVEARMERNKPMIHTDPRRAISRCASSSRTTSRRARSPVSKSRSADTRSPDWNLRSPHGHS